MPNVLAQWKKNLQWGSSYHLGLNYNLVVNFSFFPEFTKQSQRNALPSVQLPTTNQQYIQQTSTPSTVSTSHVLSQPFKSQETSARNTFLIQRPTLDSSKRYSSVARKPVHPQLQLPGTPRINMPSTPTLSHSGN